MAEPRGCFPCWLHGLSCGLSLFLWRRWSPHFGIPFVASFLMLLLAFALPSIAVAAGPQTIKFTNGPPPITLPPVQVTATYDPYGYDTGGAITVGGGRMPNLFNGTGRDFSFNNTKSATTDKEKDKAGCQGHVGDPVEVDDGAKLLSIPLFALPGEMGLTFALYYHSETGSGVDNYEPWLSSIDYLLDTDCGFTNPNIACNQVTLYRPDGSSVSFSGNHASYGNFPEIGGGGLATLTHNSDGTWILHDEDTTVQTYESDGLLTSIKDASGIGWAIDRTYTSPRSGTTKVTSVVTHTDGQSFTVGSTTSYNTTWATQNVTLTDPAGNTYTYEETGYQDNSGIWVFGLSSLTLPGTPTTTISFYGSAQLLTQMDYNGTAFWTTSFDGNDRVSADGAADGTERTSIVYSATSGGLVATITNPLGLTTTNTYTTDSQGNYLLSKVSNSAVQGCGSTTNSLAWDGNDNLTQTVDNDGIAHTYSYAANGQLQTETEAAGTAVARAINYAWDPAAQLNRLLSVTIPGESKVSYTYNAQNRLASVTHTNLTGIGTASQSLTTTYAYTLYSDGMVEAMTVTQPSPGGSDHTSYAYDTHGNLTSVTDGLGHVTTYSNYNALGEVGKVVGPNGDETDYTYDARGRVATKTTHPNGTSATWTYAYDGFGLLSQVSAPDGEVTTWSRDAEKRVKTITHNDKDGASTESFAYDANGDVTSDVIARGSDVGKSTSYVYNALGKIYQVKGSHGQVLTYAYDGNGNVLSVTDALGHKTSYAYDALDRHVGVTDAAGGITSYAYDAGDHVIGVEDPRGLVTSYAWDGLGQLWQQQSPDTGTTNLTYDIYGRLASKTRNSGITTSYTYDGLNRLTGETAGGVTRTYTWDTCTNGKGRLCTANHVNDDTVSYSYTPEGHIAARSFSFISGASYALGYAYDNMGHLASVTYPDGNVASYDYSHGAVADVRLQIGASSVYAASSVVYRPMNMAMSGWTSSNGLTNSVGYDSDLRPTSISVPNVESLNFAYDLASHVTGITNGINASLTQNIGYDAMGRIATIASTVDNESYTYDKNGNRTHKVLNGTSISITIASNSNRLLVSGGTTYGYDADGNVLTANTTTLFHYDPFGRVDVGNATWNYVVSAEDQRLRESGLAMTYFAPDRGGVLLAEELSGTWQDYVYLNGRLVSVVKAGQVYAAHDDQTGRTLTLTNAAKAVVWQAEGLPFTTPITTNSFGAFNFEFPGQYEAHGHTHNGYREYNGYLGRYAQSDPVGLAGGANTYAYVGNDPISNVDPLGLQCTTAQRILQAIQNFVEAHVDDTITLDAGDGFGIEGSLTLTKVGSSVQISGRVGIGIGIGFGTAVTANAHIGNPTGFGVQGSVAGGDAFSGGAASASAANGGPGASAGVGLGLGAGATATVGYSGDIGSFHSTSAAAGGAGCGCHH